MDKNQREKDFLYKWASENSNKYCFSGMDQEKESYFIKREEKPNSYIREYKFESLPELKRELDILWGNNDTLEKVKKIIGVAALKNKPSVIIQEQVKAEEKRDTGDKLPVFIYNF